MTEYTLAERDYPFTEAESQAAYDAWGCNCGPAALAFALQLPLSAVRGKIPGFEERHYTSPTMMRVALANLGRRFTAVEPDKMHDLFHHDVTLVRVQFTGPWTERGANPKWAYRQTHWVACWEEMREYGVLGAMRINRYVFDVNGGIRTFGSWEEEIVPLLTAAIPRAFGGWFPTHIWRLAAKGEVTHATD